MFREVDSAGNRTVPAEYNVLGSCDETARFPVEDNHESQKQANHVEPNARKV
jgi:hypothetical protein